MKCTLQLIIVAKKCQYDGIVLVKFYSNALIVQTHKVKVIYQYFLKISPINDKTFCYCFQFLFNCLFFERSLQVMPGPEGP